MVKFAIGILKLALMYCQVGFASQMALDSRHARIYTEDNIIFNITYVPPNY